MTACLGGCASSHYYPGAGEQAPVVIESDASHGHAGFEVPHIPLDELLAQARTTYETRGLIEPRLAANVINAAVREQRWDVAEGFIGRSSEQQMALDEYASFSLAAINYWNQTGQFVKAESWLHSSTLQNQLPMMAVRDQVLLGMARAETLFGLQRYSASAMERIFLEDLLEESELRRRNTEGIWRALLKLSPDALRQQHRKARNDSYRAWLELAMLQQDINVDIDTQAAALRQWQNRWPNHEANFQLPGSVQSLETMARNRPRRVGVFIPLSGKLARAGKALRDGIAAAYFGTDSSYEATPHLVFYDTGAQSIDALYQQAQLDNVELIIGPLQKDNVKALFTMPTDIPILTLNFVEDELPPPLNIIQFGLAAEDEARQLAQFAQRNRHQQIMVLHVNKSWAQRAAFAFAKQWQQSGNKQVKLQSLSSMASYSAEIAHSLAIDNSKARHARLQNIIGQRLEFNPRRRQDIDLIVLFANSKQARAIKPLLAYHYAGKIPVIASSQIFDGKNESKKNRDLNGVVFSEMPWILHENPGYQPLPSIYRNSKSLSRLFAMGVDAYQLHDRLQQLSRDRYTQLLATTGRLSVVDNRVVRELPLATFAGGKVVPLAQQATLHN
ncbi:MAG: penicillin-binding protein activator [Pseudomonadales bacterium]|nr:penicillin-binding protein activator [Pseudomonadales bacterium]